MSVFYSRPDDFKAAVQALHMDEDCRSVRKEFCGRSPYQIKKQHWNQFEEYHRQPILEMGELALAALAHDQGKNLISLLELNPFQDTNPAWKENLKEKLAVLANSDYIQSFRHSNSFGFTTYPGYLLIDGSVAVARGLNREACLDLAYPAVYEFTTAGNAPDHLKKHGWMAFVFLKPQVMSERKEIVFKKTVEAVQILQKLGAQVTGLGGLLASYTDGGKRVAESVGGGVTTGHNYTVINILNTLQEGARQAGKNVRDMRLAIVGAAGSVGSGCAVLAAQQHQLKNILLVDPRDISETLKRVREVGGDARAASLNEVSTADGVIFATSAHRALLDASRFKSGAIVVDDSQPKNIDWESAQSRRDVWILEGGAVQVPEGSEYCIRPAFGPSLLELSPWSRINNPLAGSNEVPCCMAEAMIWSMSGRSDGKYSLGRTDLQLAKELATMGSRLGFKPGKLQNYGSPVVIQSV